MNTLFILGLFAIASSFPAPQAIPAGTILPVRLSTSLSSDRCSPGQRITARLMQTVPLPDHQAIRAGAKLVGHVVRVNSAAAGGGAEIAIHFDELKTSGTTLPLTVSLRAMASYMELQDAQDPAAGADRGTMPAAYTTVQVGGDVVYRGGGPVMHGNNVVGEPVPDGVLVRLEAKPAEGCRGDVDGNDQPQALWLFASNACGAYGLPLLTITHAGRSAPLGEIVLTARSGELKVSKGTGMLLRVIR